MATMIVNGSPVEVATCNRCGMGVSMVDPFFHAERYGHDAEWDTCDESRRVTAGAGAFDVEVCQREAGHAGECEFGGLN